MKCEIQPGDPICNINCPCCGASLEVTHGDDEGEIAVIGSSRKTPDPAPVIAAAARLVWIIRNEAGKEGEVEVHTDMLADALRAYDGEATK